MTSLFSPLTLRDVTLRNRTAVAPMCQYSAKGGVATNWHLVHLGRFAIGGFGLVMVEATAVLPEGRISYGDLGLWHDAQIPPLARVAEFLKSEGAVPAIQLAHAGRKAASPIWWRGAFNETDEEKQTAGFETWVPVAPSPIAHSASPDYQTPLELDQAGIQNVIDSFVAAAIRADKAGFDVAEIHAAHGYLLSQFLSPLANQRTDAYGSSRENRMRLLLEVTEAVRAVWPAEKPLFARLSVADGSPGGWQVEDSVALTTELKSRGIDMIDCSSGGFDGYAVKPEAGYQLEMANAVKDAGLPVMAVGLVHDAKLASDVIAEGRADLIALARGALEDPNWPAHAFHALHPDADDYSMWNYREGPRIRDKDRSLKQRSFAS